MRRWPIIGAALLLLASAAGPLAAQRVPRSIKYGKWVLAGAAVGLNILAADAHNEANAAFDELQGRCSASRRLCNRDAQGRYVDPVSASLARQTMSADGRARRWLVVGETALLGAAAMFVYELTRPKGLPPNKTFEPEFRTTGREAYAGLRIRF